MTLEEALARIKALEDEAKATAKTLKAVQAEADRAEDLETQLAKVKAKNSELLGEKKDLQKKLDAGTGGEDAKALRERIEAEYKAPLEELTKRLDAAEAERNKVAIDAAISDALDKAKVAVPLKAAATALLRAQRKIELANGSVLVDGKPIADAVTEWAASPEGKPFIPASPNGGSAAPGGASGSLPKRKSEMTAAEKGAFVREHGAKAFSELAA